MITFKQHIYRKINKTMDVRNEKGDITTDPIDSILREYYEKLYAKTSDSLYDLDKFLERHFHLIEI